MAQGFQVLPRGTKDPGFPQPQAVVVTEAVGASSTFELVYPFTIEEGDLPLLADDRLGPQAELVVTAAEGDTATAVLVRGVVSTQKARLVVGGDGSQLVVSGSDFLVALDREQRTRKWADASDDTILSSLIAGCGATPRVSLPAVVTRQESKAVLMQRETDLHLLHRLARHQGCWVWSEYSLPQAPATVHVERPPTGAAASGELYLNGPKRNIDSVELQWNIHRAVAASSACRDAQAGTDMDGSVQRSPLAQLAGQGLADIAQAPVKALLSVVTAEAADLTVRSEAAAIEQGWFVAVQLRASGKRLRQVFHAAQVLALHGLGARHSGKYLVARVVHHLDDDDHTMDLTLVRDSWE